MTPALTTIDEDRQPRQLRACAPNESGALRRAALATVVTRVLVAHDQAVVRAGLRAMLERDRRIKVVAEAATGDAATRLVAVTRPDVVVIDAAVPGLDSVDATRRIRSESGAAVMLLIASEADKRILGALSAGAAGVLLANAESSEFVRAVELLARGDALLAPSITRRLIAELESRPLPDCPDLELVDDLTVREREVVGLVGQGLDNGEIAAQLVITRATAKSHVSHAMLKIGATDRAKVVVFAYEAGLVVPRAEATLAA